MIVNPEIQKQFDAIAKGALDLSNTKVEQYKYIRRFAKVFSKTLSEEEQVYVLMMLLEMVHYKNVMVNPDTLSEINNIKIKNYFMFFLMFTAGLIIIAVLFRSNSSLTGVTDMVKGMFELFLL